ncbi:NERD domain-containing protein [Agromyces sp. ZXT2-6]|uniref:NERD domain-containing protein n=1 Tax=Agromyces sp. ZXT2-6 TaxID=3461153 RepID=UPI004054C4C0
MTDVRRRPPECAVIWGQRDPPHGGYRDRMSPTTPDAKRSRRAVTPPPAPKGWYVDWEAEQWRWWSGTSWTEHVHPRHPDALEMYLPEGATETRLMTDLRGRLPAQSLLEHLASSDAVAAGAASPVEELRSWYTGAVGERHVGWLLQQLGAEWTVLHSVPVGTEGSDIDHVIVGPPGAFTINAKHHAGKSIWVAGNVLQVDGQYQPYIRNAIHEARRAQQLLSRESGLTVEVTGLIVLVGARQVTIKQEPDPSNVRIRVVRDSELLSALQQRRAYSDAQVQRIVEAAVRPHTWSPRRLVASDHATLLTAFSSLEQRLKQSHATSGSRLRTRPVAAARPSRAAPSARKINRRRKLWVELVRTALLVSAAIVGLNLVLGHLGGGQ